MEFKLSPVQNYLSNLRNKTSKYPNFIVTEAVTRGHTIDVEGETMGVWITKDSFIEGSNVKEVTDPIYFKNGNDPTDGGLFSPIIFGETSKERAKNHGYIDLKRKFFHPYVYEILKRMNKKIDIIASGQGSWIIEEGEIKQISDPQDKRYDENNTGLDWLIKNFRKIKFKDTGTETRKKRLSFFDNLKDDEIFITKFVVIPVFYRDYSIANGKKDIPDINDYYKDILINVKSFDNEILSIAKHLTLYKIQNKLVEIRQFGQTLLEKKKGHFQKAILGKATDYGARGVISVPSLNGCDSPKDCIVDILHTGLPLSYCLSMGYPFIIKWVTEFFEERFRNRSMVPSCIKNKDGTYDVEYLEIEDQTEIFTKDFIDKKIEMYIKTYGAERFEPIKIKLKDGRWADMYFPGKSYATTPDDPRSNTIGTRPMTWTDIFFLAAVETLSDKHVYITRYPIQDYFGTFPSKISVLSTIKTTSVVIDGKVYEHYPIIDLSLPPDLIATQFIDTISLSNTYLAGLGGD